MSRLVLECLVMMNNDESETNYHVYRLHTGYIPVQSVQRLPVPWNDSERLCRFPREQSKQ